MLSSHESNRISEACSIEILRPKGSILNREQLSILLTEVIATSDTSVLAKDVFGIMRRGNSQTSECAVVRHWAA